MRIVNLLSQLGVPVYRQGSIAADQEYPDKFITYWQRTSSDPSAFDNRYASHSVTTDINAYAHDPDVAEELLGRAIRLLRIAGYVVPGIGYDLRTDEPSVIGRGVEASLRIN